ncbi:50S ribosomal protein P1 [Candidatus Woesearchaeota archaeon]|nr:50S ribosomal protein P1 [Candidatus Woesearchaeota archaeon]
MEYIYSAMLIHKAGGKVDEATVSKVLEAAGVKVDNSRVKALIASLEGVNIDEAIEKAAVAQVAAPAASAESPAQGAESKKEDKAKEAKEEAKSQEQAAAGLGSLFG